MSIQTDAIMAYGIVVPDGMDGIEDVYEAIGSSEDWEKQGKFYNVEILLHCSSIHRMYFIAIKESVVVASRGFPEKLDIKKISTQKNQEKWLLQLNKFLEDKRLPKRLKSKKPGWYVFSYWG